MPVHVGWEQGLKFKYILGLFFPNEFLYITLAVLELIL